MITTSIGTWTTSASYPGIEEASVAGGWKLALARVEEVKHEHFVSSVPKKTQCSAGRFRIDQEIGQEDH